MLSHYKANRKRWATRNSQALRPCERETVGQANENCLIVRGKITNSQRLEGQSFLLLLLLLFLLSLNDVVVLAAAVVTHFINVNKQKLGDSSYKDNRLSSQSEKCTPGHGCECGIKAAMTTTSCHTHTQTERGRGRICNPSLL